MRFYRELRSLINRNYFVSAAMIARTSLREQYRNSFLGLSWALVQSVVYIFTLSLVFSVLMRSSIKGYAIFMTSGLVPWQFLVSATTRGAGSLCNRRAIFHHTPLPKTMFVLADVMAQFHTFLISMCVALVFAFALQGFHPIAFLVFPAVLPLIVTAIALAILFAYVSAYLWDIPHVLNILFQLAVWTVPIMYPITAIPEHLRHYFALNPFYVLIHPIQELLYENVMPPLQEWLAGWAVAFACIGAAYIVYGRLRKNVIYYL